MKGKRGRARFGNMAVPENLIKKGGLLKESTRGIGHLPTQNRRSQLQLQSNNHIRNRSSTKAALVYVN